MKINSKAATDLILETLKAGLVPMLKGSPGIGKSDIIREIGNNNNLEIIDFRLAQADPTDMLGMPFISGNRTDNHPPVSFPIAGDEPPKGKNGWILFFDEINSAPLSVQAASYKIILDRMVGNHKLHPKVAIVAAGNLDSDKAITNRISTALQSRMIHFELEVDHKSWLEWANNNEVDYRIKSFIGFKPEMLHHFDPNHKDNTFPTP